MGVMLTMVCKVLDNLHELEQTFMTEVRHVVRSKSGRSSVGRLITGRRVAAKSLPRRGFPTLCRTEVDHVGRVGVELFFLYEVSKIVNKLRRVHLGFRHVPQTFSDTAALCISWSATI